MRTPTHKRSALPVTCSLAILIGACIFTASVHGADRAVAELESATDCCPSTLTFTLEGGSLDTRREVTLEARVQEVEDYFVLGENVLVVQGRLRHGGWIFVAADLETRSQRQTIWAYHHALSPDREALVYETHYPRFGVVGSRRSVLMLHRFRDGTSQPYSSEPLKHTWGRPIFPEANLFGNIAEPGVAAEWWRETAYSWAPTGAAVAFLASYQEGGTGVRDLVVITGLDTETNQPTVWRQRINEELLVREDAAGNVAVGDGNLARFEKLLWDSSCSIRAVGRDEESLFKREHVFSLPCVSEKEHSS